MSDKAGLEPLARALAAHGAELVSTGGTASAIRALGLTVRDVSDLSGVPEMLDGRVKTLVPAVHGGLLARRDLSAHMDTIAQHGIGPIDLVAIDLYPFEAALARGAPRDELIENIDIGGPAMIRSAAKNHAAVAVLTDAQDYEPVIAELGAGGTTLATRRRLAAKAYAATCAYDSVIASWFAFADQREEFPTTLPLMLRKHESLRYGENPHQQAAFYTTAGSPPGGLAAARQVQGKELSYNNLLDADAALELIAEFGGSEPAVAIIKHGNPCGVAFGRTVADAYERALAADPVSAFGGIVAANRALDAEAARAITGIFTEVVLAPDADEAAQAVFAAKKNLRLLLTGALPDPARGGLNLRTISGGLLVQARDNAGAPEMRVVTRRAPTGREIADLKLAWIVAKHVKSNAIVYAKDGAVAGVGAGQMNRRDSARIAAIRAREAADAAGWPQPATVGSAVASDAFFPFADGVLAAVEAGATAVIQPGGSIRDEEVIACADEAGVAMVFTGTRHFRH